MCDIILQTLPEIVIKSGRSGIFYFISSEYVQVRLSRFTTAMCVFLDLLLVSLSTKHLGSCLIFARINGLTYYFYENDLLYGKRVALCLSFNPLYAELIAEFRHCTKQRTAQANDSNIVISHHDISFVWGYHIARLSLSQFMGPVLLIWFNFNPSMNKQSHAQ